MPQLALSASFEYLCHGCTAVINILLFWCIDRYQHPCIWRKCHHVYVSMGRNKIYSVHQYKRGVYLSTDGTQEINEMIELLQLHGLAEVTCDTR